MLVNDTDLDFAGTVIADETMHVNDEDSVYAVYDLANCSCGMTYELGASIPYLRFTPGIQVPPKARRGLERFLFEADDDSLSDFAFDSSDGELTLNRHLRKGATAAEVDQEAAATLAWIDEVAYPTLLAYVADAYRPDETPER